MIRPQNKAVILLVSACLMGIPSVFKAMILIPMFLEAFHGLSKNIRIKGAHSRTYGQNGFKHTDGHLIPQNFVSWP